MMTRRGNSGRGSHLQLTALTLGFGVMVLVIVMLATPVHVPEAPKAGTPALYEGINLPIADAAEPGEPSPETTVEIPLSWGKDPEDSIKKLRERVKQAAERLPKSTESPGGRLDLDEESHMAFGDGSLPSIIVAIDRDLRFPLLGRTLREGRHRQVINFRIACRTSAKGSNIGYLTITLPRACAGGSNEERGVLRVEVSPQAEGIRYGLTRSRWLTVLAPQPQVPGLEEDAREIKEVTAPWETIGSFDGLQETMAELRKETQRNAATIFWIAPCDNVTVQQFIDVYNSAVKTGCRRILIGRAPTYSGKETP